MTNSAPPPLPRTSSVSRGVKVVLILLGAIAVVVTAFTLWRVPLSRDNQSRLNQIARSGQPVDAADLNVRYSPVPDDQNAARLWMKGVDQMVPAYSSRSKMPWYFTKPPARNVRLTDLEPRDNDPRSYPALVASNQVALHTFKQAASLSKSRYAVDFSRTLLALMPHLPRLRSAVDLLKVEAMVTCETQSAGHAVSAVLTMFAAERSLRAEPSLIAHLVRFSINRDVFETTEHILNHVRLAEPDLQTVSHHFAASDDMTNLFRAFVAERAMYVTLFQSPRSVGKPTDDKDDDGVVEALHILGSPLLRATGFVDRDFRFYLDAMTTNLVIATLPDAERFHSKKHMEQIAAHAKSKYCLISGLLLPAMAKVVVRDATHRAECRVAQTALAVERYRFANSGTLPDELSALVPAYLDKIPLDPFDGKPIRFKPLQNGYVVYCIGPDEKDDGGAERVRNAPKGAPEDVTFIVERPQSE